MKLFKTILFTLLTLSFFTNVSSAANRCPGDTARLSWSSANCASDFGRDSTANQCQFNEATPNTSGSKVITAGNTVGTFCTVTLSCKGNQGTSVSASSSLSVVDGPQCCSVGTAASEGRSVWSTNQTRCIAYPKPTTTAVISPAPTATSTTVGWQCAEPATRYTITRDAPWTTAPAWASGTIPSATAGLEVVC